MARLESIIMPSHFDPVTLRLFVAVCEERSIAKAADREAIVASAVSKRIAAIEREIGAPLLVRGRRGILPTAAGETLLRQARDVLGYMGRWGGERTVAATGVLGRGRGAARGPARAEDLPDDIAAFLRTYQSVRVSLDERVSAEIVHSVAEGAADIGVLWDATDLRGLQQRPYRCDHLRVAVPASHPLARRKRLHYAETLGEVSIGVAPGGMVDTMLKRQAALLGRTPNQRIQVSSLEAACRIVAAGLGIAILPHEAVVTHATSTDLAMVPLADAWARRRFVVCSRPAVPAAARLLIDHLEARARSAD